MSFMKVLISGNPNCPYTANHILARFTSVPPCCLYHSFMCAISENRWFGTNWFIFAMILLRIRNVTKLCQEQKRQAKRNHASTMRNTQHEQAKGVSESFRGKNDEGQADSNDEEGRTLAPVIHSRVAVNVFRPNPRLGLLPLMDPGPIT